MRTVSYSFGIATTGHTLCKVNSFYAYFLAGGGWGDYQKGLEIGSQTAFQSVGVIFIRKGCCLPKSLGASKNAIS